MEKAKPAGDAQPMEVDGAEAQPAAAGKDWFVDMPIYEYRDNMEIKPTLVNGEVSDWEAAEEIYKHALHGRLQSVTRSVDNGSLCCRLSVSVCLQPAPAADGGAGVRCVGTACQDV